MRSGPQYQRLDNEDTSDQLEMGAISNPLQTESAVPSDSTSAFLTIKVLLREQVFEITGLSSADSVSRLKEFIASATEVPTNRQRLIFSGRSLTPEDKPLSFFKIPNNGSVHLFPLPAATPVTSAPGNLGTTGTLAANVRPATNNALQFDADMHTPMHFDSSIQQHSREVRLWSMLLLFLSTMALFNNVSYYSATGKLGSGNLDTVVFVMDTIVSGLGSWVGILGLKSVRTLDLDDVRKYVRWLGVVAVCSMVMRILWVFDVIYAVKRAVKESEAHAAGGGGDTDPNSGVPDSGTGGETGDPSSGEVIDRKAITAFGIQATIIAMICLFAWSSCFRRAVSFYRAVQWHDIESQSATATNTTNNNNNTTAATATATVANDVSSAVTARPLPLSATVV